MPRYGGNPDSSLPPRPCVTCGSTFQPYRASQVACCRSCRDRQPHHAAAQARRNRSPEIKARKNAARRARYASQPAARIANLDAQLRRNYGISFADYSLMLGEQDFRCLICREPASGGAKAASRLHVDHDHETGFVRGLLCTRCNQGLGYFRDNPDLLRSAVEYLERSATTNRRTA